ncbi:hypothetical protein M404DRAFT_991261 [Pisolithus tinctorius Marx 270]|uniref:Uncharacterized protein n=1 Tax=Pisolithus tinctorius Marx 270 TaxID=870435 RepID=A0A0C3PJZ2_PISTI|nr:hypothetical protein M404DRAFT_991261 [Pisolithus tinctorius Marx 270]
MHEDLPKMRRACLCQRQQSGDAGSRASDLTMSALECSSAKSFHESIVGICAGDLGKKQRDKQ